jgi:3-methyladenine DNA glycosylase AlkD
LAAKKSVKVSEAYGIKPIQKILQNISTVAALKRIFVQKAKGWALREYSKSNASVGKKFVSGHSLPKLSKSEALKRIID